MPAKNQRQVDNQWLISGNDADSIEYNPASGARKSLWVGPRLVPIPTGASTWTTNVTAATALPVLGATLYIYNNSDTAAAVTVGKDSSITAQAIGAIDANGNVGVACAPNVYTYLSMGLNQWIIASSDDLIVYLVEDPTRLNQQTPPLMPQNVSGFVPPINS